jgi:hypothetical protein
MHTLYLGASWAVQSFESVSGIDDAIKTNLAQELDLNNYTFLAEYAKSNLDQIKRAQEFMAQHADLAPFRIVFVTGNSLDDGHKIEGISQIDFAKYFLTSDNPIGIIKGLEQDFNQQINALGVPVALIGAGTDVTCESYENITVIHSSWQNFLAQRCGLNSFYGWPINVGRTWLKGSVIPEYGPPVPINLETAPSATVRSETHKIKIFWKIMQQHNLLFEGHPTILGNKLFAQEIKQSVNNWIDKHQ